MHIELGVRALKNLILSVGIVAALVCLGDERKPDATMVFKTIGKVKLEAHVFYPEGHKASDKRPGIGLFFGGGWTGGNPNQFCQHARGFNKEGMVAISFHYRVASRHKTTPFECVADGKSAIRWMRQNAAKLGIDQNRVVAGGGSAGGHVAACTGVIKGHDDPQDDATISSIPNAMLLYNPVIDTTAKGYGAKKVAGRETEISPCHHVTKGIVPIMVFHGTKDTTVPFENVERFETLMKKAGNTCELVAFNGKGHGFFNGSWFRKKNGDTDFNKTMTDGIRFLKAQGILK